MSKKLKKLTNEKTVSRARRALRVRRKIFGSTIRPRLCVTRTNRSLILQLVDDELGATLVSLYSNSQKPVNINEAKALGKSFAEKAISKGFAQAVFDRGGRIFHGRVAAVAQGAREGGLSF